MLDTSSQPTPDPLVTPTPTKTPWPSPTPIWTAVAPTATPIVSASSLYRPLLRR